VIDPADPVSGDLAAPADGDQAAWRLAGLIALTAHHQACCPDYGRVVAITAPGFRQAGGPAQLPMLPVSLFKSHLLQSVEDVRVTTVLTSSGTTGPAVSRIAVDASTAERQSAALAASVEPFLGVDRLPMIVLDSKAALTAAGAMSARAAAVLGMMRFGRRHHFAFDAGMGLDLAGLAAFLERFGRRPFLLFGFTFVVWQHFLSALPRWADLSQGLLLHGGGWKRLARLAVDDATVKAALKERCGLVRVRNFYGMAEQLGGIFLEGEDGLLHPPPFADVLIRDPDSGGLAEPGQPGLIQVLSLVPRSYPGHSLLTEDIGVAPVGGRNRGFSVLGRVHRAPPRGCGDVVAFADKGARPPC
jgi:hypothetical protein